MKRAWLITSIIAVMSGSGAWTQSFDSLPLFDTSIVAKRYLWYCWLRNAFDTCNVDYTVGEFRVRKQDSLQLVFLSLRKDEAMESSISPCVYGVDFCGVDTILRQRCRTHPFYVPDSSTIEFFRLLSASLSCGKRRAGVKDTLIMSPQPTNMVEAQWKLYEGCILDTSEFVLELVRASDDAVLAILDSVGVLPNPTSQLVQRYGTNPDIRTLSVPIPQQAWGTMAYVRVSPRRYGPTPFGMQMWKVGSGIRLSAKYPNEDTSVYYPRWLARFFDPQGQDPFDSLSFAAAIASVDNQAQQYGGCVIYLPSCISGGSGSEIRRRYDSLHAYIAHRGYVRVFDDRFQNDTIGRWCQQCWWEAIQWYYSTLEDTASSTMTAQIRPVSTVTPISAKPVLKVANPTYEHQPLRIIASRALDDATLQVYDVTGKLVTNKGINLSTGVNEIPLHLPSGLYRLVVVDARGLVLHQFGIVILR